MKNAPVVIEGNLFLGIFWHGVCRDNTPWHVRFTEQYSLVEDCAIVWLLPSRLSIYGCSFGPILVAILVCAGGKMKKFNIRKVLDGLTAVSSSSSASPQPGNRENDTIQENLQSEHFQLCKVGSYHAGGRRGWPRANGTPAAQSRTLETEGADGPDPCSSNKIDVHVAIEQVTSPPHIFSFVLVDKQVDPSDQEGVKQQLYMGLNLFSDLLLRISKIQLATYCHSKLCHRLGWQVALTNVISEKWPDRNVAYSFSGISGG